MDSKEAAVAETKEMVKLRHKLVFDITQRLESFQSEHRYFRGDSYESNNKLIDMAKKRQAVSIKQPLKLFVLAFRRSDRTLQKNCGGIGHEDSYSHTQWPKADAEAMKYDERSSGTDQRQDKKP